MGDMHPGRMRLPGTASVIRSLRLVPNHRTPADAAQAVPFKDLPFDPNRGTCFAQVYLAVADEFIGDRQGLGNCALLTQRRPTICAKTPATPSIVTSQRSCSRSCSSPVPTSPRRFTRSKKWLVSFAVTGTGFSVRLTRRQMSPTLGLKRRAGQSGDSLRRMVAVRQSSTRSPATRPKSATFSVATTAPSATACAAMSSSSGPMGVPCFLSATRIWP